MSNFSQFVDRNFVRGQDLHLTLTTGWDKAEASEGCELVIVPQTIRRVLGMAHTPKRITVKAQDERLEIILGINSKTSEAHVAKFAEQARVHKQDLANRKLIASIKGSLDELGITF